MSSVWYGLFLVAILLVIRWYTESERTGSDVKGLVGRLNMRAPAEVKSETKSGWSIPGSAETSGKPTRRR